MFLELSGLFPASGMTLRSPKGAVSETVAELLSPREGLLRAEYMVMISPRGVASWNIYGDVLPERG